MNAGDMTANVYDIQRTVVQAIAAILKKDLSLVDEHVTFVQQGADEIDLFEFVLKMEDAFMIEISDDDAEKLVSVEQTVSYIAARKIEIGRASCRERV